MWRWSVLLFFVQGIACQLTWHVFEGKAYSFFEDFQNKVTHDVASKTCTDHSTSLVTDITMPVHLFLTSRMLSNIQYWVGLVRTGNAFYWPDGNSSLPSIWHGGEPTLAANEYGVRYALYGGPIVHLLSDTQTTYVFNFICEKNIRCGDREEYNMFSPGLPDFWNNQVQSTVSTQTAIECSIHCALDTRCLQYGFSKGMCSLYQGVVSRVTHPSSTFVQSTKWCIADVA